MHEQTAGTQLTPCQLLRRGVVVDSLVRSRALRRSGQELREAGQLLLPVTDGYILGADGNGRDVLTRLAYGGRVSMTIAALAALSLFIIGGVIGLVAGYAGGKIDVVLMRLVDVLLSVPGLPLLILISSLYSPGPVGLAFVLALTGWAGIARLFRGETLALRGRDYVDAARALGASNPRIVIRHIVPNLLPLLVVYTSLSLPGLMLAETGLSFLGVGVQAPTPSWATCSARARSSSAPTFPWC